MSSNKKKKGGMAKKNGKPIARKERFTLRQLSIGAGILAAAVILLIIGVWYTTGQEQAKTESRVVDLYFLNTTTNMLEAEKRIINGSLSPDKLAESVMNELKAGPKTANLAKTIPDTVEFKEGKLYESDKILEITLSEAYKALDLKDEIFCRASLVWTLTGLDFIDNINFFVGDQKLLKSNGEPMGYLNRENVKINFDTATEKTQEQTVTLYFADQNARYLVPEARVVEIKPNQLIEKYIMEALISGPRDSSLLKTLPSDVKLIDVTTNGADTCYVDFGQDFISKFAGGSSSEQLVIYSIVNSLTELKDIKKVQIYVEGSKVSDMNGHMDISSAFERDESIILKEE